MSDEPNPFAKALADFYESVPDKERYYKLIGHIIAAHSTLEFTLNVVLAKIFRLDVHEGLILTVHMSWPARLHALESWSKTSIVREAFEGEVAGLLTRLKTANEKRNYLAHGLFVEDDGALKVMRIKARGKLKTDIKHFADVDALEKAHKDLLELVLAVGSFEREVEKFYREKGLERVLAGKPLASESGAEPTS